MKTARKPNPYLVYGTLFLCAGIAGGCGKTEEPAASPTPQAAVSGSNAAGTATPASQQGLPTLKPGMAGIPK